MIKPTDSKEAQALAVLRASFQADPDYALSWHCNLASCAINAGLEQDMAQRLAVKFMKLCFDFDTTTIPEVARWLK